MSRSKRTSMSEQLNAQLGLASVVGHDRSLADDEDLFAAPHMADADVDHGADEPQRKRSRVEGRRLRGPLSSSLSTGAYAAVPVKTSSSTKRKSHKIEVEADEDDDDADLTFGNDSEEEDGDEFGGESTNVDDIFGMLDEDEGEVIAGNDIDDEDAYAEWLEKSTKSKKKKRSSTAAGATSAAATNLLEGATEDDMNVLKQVAELRARQLSLFSQPDGSTNINNALNAQERDQRSGQLRQLVDTYSQLLRVRVRLQPVVAKAVLMPQYYALTSFYTKDETGSTIKKAMAGVHDDLRKTYKSLAAISCKAVEGSAFRSVKLDVGADTPTTTTAPRKRARDNDEALEYGLLRKLHASIVTRADAVLTYWGTKVVQARPKNAKAALAVVNQPLVDQIKSIAAAKVRLLAKVQKNRSHAPILGHPSHMGKSPQDRAIHIAEGDLDDEIYDDGDFVRELVHHSGAAAAKLEAMLKSTQDAAEGGANSAAAGLGSSSGSRVGMNKRTKGKAVSYEPRPKLVGFMTRLPQPDGGAAQDALLASLFK